MPTITIDIWSSVSHLFEFETRKRHSWEMEVEEGTTLAGVLEKLARDNPGFAKTMYKPGSNDPSGSVTVVINERLPELLDGFRTIMGEGDRITLVQAYAGG